jgi:hypothetical protein
MWASDLVGLPLNYLWLPRSNIKVRARCAPCTNPVSGYGSQSKKMFGRSTEVGHHIPDMINTLTAKSVSISGQTAMVTAWTSSGIMR